MENYGRCKDCEYGEPTDCSWKWSCTWYHTLEDPDELKDCNHYRERDQTNSYKKDCRLTIFNR